MANTTANNAAAVVSKARTGSTLAWTNPTNALTSNNTYATQIFTASEIGEDLIFNDFGFAVPTTATIVGVKVEVEHKTTSNTRPPLTDEVMLGTYVGTTWTSKTATKGSAGAAIVTTTEGFDVFPTTGFATDTWGYTGGLTPAIVNATTFAVALAYTGQSTPSSTLSVDSLRVTIYYDTIPVYNTQPTISYNTGSRLGVNNTPGVVSFKATDDITVGSGAMTYAIRTSATVGGGTSVVSGTMTSGAVKTVNLNYNAPGMVAGSNTLWVQVSDGVNTAVVSNSFTVLRDDVAPTAATVISHTPNPVLAATTYTVTFTPHDATSNAAGEINYEIRDAAAGAGTLLTSGSCTAGTAVTTATITDAGLVTGSNTRYIRQLDGAFNATDTSFTVTATLSTTYNDIGPADTITEVTAGVDHVILTETATPDAHALVTTGTVDLGNFHDTANPDPHALVTIGTVDGANQTDISNPDAHAVVTTGNIDALNQTDVANADPHALGTIGSDTVVLTETASPDAHTLIETGTVDSALFHDVSNPDAHALGTIGSDAQVSNDLISPVVIASVQTGTIEQETSSELGATQLLAFVTTYSLESVGLVYDEFTGSVDMVLVETGSEAFINNELTNAVVIVSNQLGTDLLVMGEFTSPQTLVVNTVGSVDKQTSNDTNPQTTTFNTVGTIDTLNASDFANPQPITEHTITSSEYISYFDTGTQTIVENTTYSIENIQFTDAFGTAALVFNTLGPVDKLTVTDISNPLVLNTVTPVTFDFLIFTDTANTVIIISNQLGVDIYSTGLFDHYHPMPIVVLELYEASSLTVDDPYSGNITVLAPYDGTLIVQR